MTRLSDTLSKPHTPSDDTEQVIFDSVAVVLTRQVLELLCLISEDVGCHGNWAMAVGANRLRDRLRYSGQAVFLSSQRYSEDTYEETTGVTLPSSVRKARSPNACSVRCCAPSAARNCSPKR
jgi:hypothetical protein